MELNEGFSPCRGHPGSSNPGRPRGCSCGREGIHFPSCKQDGEAAGTRCTRFSQAPPCLAGGALAFLNTNAGATDQWRYLTCSLLCHLPCARPLVLSVDFPCSLIFPLERSIRECKLHVRWKVGYRGARAVPSGSACAEGLSAAPLQHLVLVRECTSSLPNPEPPPSWR